MQITLGRILKAVVAFKGLMIEWVLVKGYSEEFTNENGQLDLWTESRFQVFRKLTENANAAMLHFYSPTLPELAVRSFMVNICINFLHLKINIQNFHEHLQQPIRKHKTSEDGLLATPWLDSILQWQLQH